MVYGGKYKGGGGDKVKKRLNAGKRALDDEEERVEIRKKIMMENFKIILKFKVGQDMIGVSPISLSNGLKKVVGDVELAKVLRDGSLLIIVKMLSKRLRP
ncbi:hypothetical protein GOODEAATRI_016415 [Goodea atripinnis]|uniref:Uncharacterized protein n=1 Tax=Goodea atripinnis TaxID=208336 RepID=A0ABV0PYH9_9TELE